MQLNTQQQGAVAVEIDGVTIPGPWQLFEGDEVTADIEKVWPGHMSPSIGKAGPPQHADVTTGRTYDTDAFSDGTYAWLKSKVSTGAATLTRMILNPDKSVRESTNLTGTLTGVSRSDYDSGSGTVTQVRLTFSIDGP